MARRYFLDELPPPGAAVLGGDVAHHLAAVLRAAPGDVLVLADGRGRQCEATVQRVAGGRVHVLAAPASTLPPPPRRVHLAFAPPRWTRAEWLFEHATEVGVAVFWPLSTGRARAQPPRPDRWAKLVRAAAGQCDRAFLPEIRAPRSLETFLAEPDLPAVRLLAAPGAPPPAPLCSGGAVLLVGPEGGLGADEVGRALANGFRPCGLGPHVLRTETAALVGAALLLASAADPTAGAGSPPPRS